MEIKFEPIGLATLGGAQLQQRFDATLAAVVESMRDVDAAASGGTVKGRVSLVVDIEWVRDSDRLTLVPRVDAAHPKTRAMVIPVTVRGGQLLAEVLPDNQTRLFRADEGGAE